MTAIETLKTELQRLDRMLVDRHGETLSVMRDWSYSDGDMPWDIVEGYSDVLTVSFNGTAFIAKDEQGITVALEIVEDGDIETAAEAMADRIDCILPKRDIPAEIAEARAMDMLFRLEESA